MYCLAGGGKGFWCYSVPGLGDITVDGICPEESSLIADQTPTFIWPVVGSAQKYGLAVSLNPDMSSPVLQDSTNDTCYEVTEKLTNGTYYWQSASRQGATWTWSAVHSFTLDGGWTRLADVPVDVTYGASLAYEKDFYNNEECLIAFTAGEQYLAVYSVAGNSWSHDISTPKPQGIGSAIVTHEAASSTPPDWAGPWAVFGEYSDSLWYHTNDKPGWIRYNDAGEFPQSLGSGASLAYGIESGTHYLYLIVGDNGSGPRNDFYRQELPTSGGGGQAGSTRPASASARLISRAGKVTVEYQLSVPAQVRATVFDALGRQVELLDAGAQAVGVHQLSWDTGTHGRRPSAGACFVVLDIGDQRASLKAVVK